MQLHYHSPLRPSVSQPAYHPIFHRVKERGTPSSPMSEAPPDTDIVWEKRFMACSYAMVSRCAVVFGKAVLMSVFGSLLLLCALLLCADQAGHRTVLNDRAHCPLPTLSRPRVRSPNVPARSKTMGPMASWGRYRQLVKPPVPSNLFGCFIRGSAVVSVFRMSTL